MVVAAEEILRQPTGLLSWPSRTFTFIRRYPVIAAIILTLLVVGAAFAPFLSPHDPGQRILDDRDIPPLWVGDGMVSHPLGTDHLGRDIFSRILYGARISLMVAGIAVSVGVVAGTATGLIAGYFGGWADEILMRAVDLWLALPFLLLVLVVAVSLGSSLTTVIWASGSFLLVDRRPQHPRRRAVIKDPGLRRAGQSVGGNSRADHHKAPVASRFAHRDSGHHFAHRAVDNRRGGSQHSGCWGCRRPRRRGAT